MTRYLLALLERCAALELNDLDGGQDVAVYGLAAIVNELTKRAEKNGTYMINKTTPPSVKKGGE